MSDLVSSSFVREALVSERPAPVKTTGFIGFVRTRLLNSPTNILLTVLGALLIWFTVIPALRFLLVDAVWHGSDRTACLAENAGHPVGACWPFIEAKFYQIVYGFYPEAERWRASEAQHLAKVAALDAQFAELLQHRRRHRERCRRGIGVSRVEGLRKGRNESGDRLLIVGMFRGRHAGRSGLRFFRCLLSFQARADPEQCRAEQQREGSHSCYSLF